MGCKCTTEEHGSEIISLDVNMAYNHSIPNGRPISNPKESNKALYEENYFNTNSKFGSVVINEDLAATAKSRSDIDRKILCEAIFKEINFARTKPIEYSKKIKNLKKSIYIDNNQYYFKINESSSFKLKIGPEAFDNCISFLKSQSPLKPFILCDDIKFDDFTYFSSQNRNSEVGTDTLLHECTSFQFLSDVIEKKIEQSKENYEIINFHYDKTTFSPELSVLSQIVDDTSSNYQRRMNIFNTKTDSVGINCIKINTHPSLYCIYLVFARSLSSNLDIIP